MFDSSPRNEKGNSKSQTHYNNPKAFSSLQTRYDDDQPTSAGGEDSHLPMIDQSKGTRDSLKLPKKMRRGMSLENADILNGTGKDKKIPTMSLPENQV